MQNEGITHQISFPFFTLDIAFPLHASQGIIRLQNKYLMSLRGVTGRQV